MDKTLVRIVEDRKRKFVGVYDLVRNVFRATNASYHDLDPFLKLCCLSNMCDWTATENDEIRAYIDGNPLEMPRAERKQFWLDPGAVLLPPRNIPLGYDSEGRAYWYFDYNIAKGSYTVFRSRIKGSPASLDIVSLKLI